LNKKNRINKKPNTPGTPLGPYANSGGQINVQISPLDIRATPLSQAGITIKKYLV
jgi:hypothetical protein